MCLWYPQKPDMSDALELEFYMIVSYHVSAGN